MSIGIKKLFCFCLLITLIAVLCACGNGTEGADVSEAPAESGDAAVTEESFTPAKTVNIIANAKAGTNVDIHARTVMEAMKLNEEFAATGSNLIIVNQEDGNGAVAQRDVSQLPAGEEADNTLLTINVGDLPTMLENTDMSVEDFTIIGTTVQDKHIIYVRADSPFESFEDIVEALNDQKLVISGGKGDDVMFGSLVKKSIDPGNNLNYLQTAGTNETAVQVLGGHVDVGIGKPSVLNAYMESGDIRALAVEGDKRFEGLYADVPTLEELGYGEISYIQCRGFAASPNMSAAAREYWSGMLSAVCESEYFSENYVDKYLSEMGYMDSEEATQYFLDAQASTIEANS